jgi:hypothetical protein
MNEWKLHILISAEISGLIWLLVIAEGYFFGTKIKLKVKQSVDFALEGVPIQQ